MLTKQDLQEIRTIVQEESMSVVKEEIKPLKKKLNKVSKDLDIVIRQYDSRISANTRSIKRIEDHIGLAAQ